ncbi:MAG: S9 family peptidase [Verrucomicrobia bacterium]|nr:MAG: S9 family peptidase [Verrucomicrobiota bacterium]
MRLILIPALLAAASLAASDRRPLAFDDLVAFHRVSDPQPSPDGQWIACVVTDVDKDENRANSDVWVVPTDGGEPRQLTRSPKHDRHPRWSPDGRNLAFESNRDGAFQIYVLSLDGGEARRITSLATEATQPAWSPDGRHVAFVSAVFPEFSSLPFAESDRRNKDQLEAREKSKVKARVIDSLLYRHWDSWVDGKRQHLFVVPVAANGVAAGAPRDLTPGNRDAIPTSSTFDGGDEFAFSPDGAEIVHTATPLPVREEAWNTNHDLESVDVATGERRQLTRNPAADGLPRYSPDGRWIAFRAQSRAGFEADRWQLFVLDRKDGKIRGLTRDFDQSIASLDWVGSGTLVVQAEERGTKRLYAVPLAGGVPRPLTRGGTAVDAKAIPRRNAVVFSRSYLSAPAEIERVTLDGSDSVRVTRFNETRLAGIDLPRPESAEVKGAGGTPVHLWILKPPGFDASRKYPLVFWVHGGPQGAWTDSWSYRWNAELWAAQGYVLAMPNPRGSTGFGQRFTDEISHDWGGRVYEDLMASLAWVEKQPYVDRSRMAAAGGSYGGYMMNWFQGHTDRFKTLVTHCGVYEFSTMYGTTEELWFDEWEHGVPWKNPDFDKWSPHRFAGNFKTPNLVIHGELDFRVPVHQGLSLFTTLQRKGIPSRLLYFPDEGHWVNKPQNSELWHRTVFDWLATYLK